MTRVARWATAATATVAVSATPDIARAAHTEPTSYEAAVHRCLLEHNPFWHVEEVDTVHPDGTITTEYVCVMLRITLYG